MDEQNQQNGPYVPDSQSPQPPQQPYPNQYMQNPTAPTQQPVMQGGQPEYVQPGMQPKASETGKKPSKNKKLLVLIGIGVSVFFVLLIGLALLLGGNKTAPEQPLRMNTSYDSPAGIAAALQANEVENGKFKLTANYVTGADFVREGSFYVQDGVMTFEMVTDDVKVNEFIRDLYIKQGKQAAYSDKFQGATKNFTYDFTSLLGYHYLNDVNLKQGFIPTVEAAQADATKATANKALRLGRDCSAALADLKSKIGHNLQINKGLQLDLAREGIRTKATVSFATRQTVDNAVVRFVENCFDQKAAEAKYYVDFIRQLKDNITPSPTFVTWEQGGKYMVEIRDLPDHMPFDGELTFELSEFGKVTNGKTGETASYAERRNEFGLAYSLCRVEPVITTTQAEGYRVLIEDTAYSYPVEDHTGYYCTTSQVPGEYSIAAKMQLKLDNALVAQVDKKKFAHLQSVHDLKYEAEKYHATNKRFPNTTEFTDLVHNNTGSLVVDAEAIWADKSLTYVPEPNRCIGDCSDFTLSYAYNKDFVIRRFPY